MMRLHNNKTVLLFISVIFVTALFLSIASVVNSEEVVGDSVAARNRQVPSKSVAQKILQLPSEILKIPVYAVKGTTFGVIYMATESPVRRLLNFGNPASPLYPVVGYGSNKGLSGGLGIRFRNLWTDDDRMKIKWYYSTSDYQSYKVKYSGDNYWGDNSSFQVVGSYRKRPREDFYGIGNDSKETDEVNFTLEHFEISARPGWVVNDQTQVGFELGYRTKNIFDGNDDSKLSELDSIQTLFGLTPADFRSTRFITFGLHLLTKNVDHPGRPSSGAITSFLAQYNHETGKSGDLRYVYTRLDFSKYFNLFRKRILAIRVMLQSFNFQTGNNVLPFYLKSGLGGRDNLRGYDSYRFIDDDAAFYSIEYRYPLWRAIDAFLFLDGGEVFKNWSKELKLTGWHQDYGFGLRIFNSEAVILRVQTAFSNEKTKFYLELGADW